MNPARSMLKQLGLAAASCSSSLLGAAAAEATTLATATSSAARSRAQLWLLRGFTATSGARVAQKAAGAAQKAAAAQAPPLSPYDRFKTAPPVARLLGLAGAIPFIALAPPVAKHLTSVLPADVVDNAAMLQVGYGVCIVTFLGAVHWGVAAASLSSGPIAARIANEGYIYSVLPCLAAWPVTAMEPGAGAVVLSMLLPTCLLADYTRRNMGFPQWYLPLRLPLTALATFGMLLTATRHVHEQLDRAKVVTAAGSSEALPPPPAAAAAR